MYRIFVIVFVFLFVFTNVAYAFDPVAEAEKILNNAIARDAVRALLVKQGFDAVEAANAILQKAVAREIVNQGLKNVVMNPVYNSTTGVFSYILPGTGAAAISTFLL